jgi:hypothetical protein
MTTRRCPGCWKGHFTRGQDGSGDDCAVCGLPGPKPADYEWPPSSGRWITHYINHGNTWQTAPGHAPLPAANRDLGGPS